MSYIQEQLDREDAAQPLIEGLWAGLIAETAATLDEQVPVRLLNWDPGLQIGPCRWMPRLTTVSVNVAEGIEDPHMINIAQALLPTRDDECLVAFDDNQVPWIVCWWPQ